ncbi:MAG: hypothetical protein IPI24_12815 [Ignavibacteria bacterium]|nr:hypothetical protein [Ignavibacteria bacterium]
MERFLEQLEEFNVKHAQQLASFIDNVSKSDRIMQLMLRPERPDLGVYAMYKQGNGNGPYNPSRLLCAYVGTGDRILVVGAGFIKTKDGSIQNNALADREAKFLADVVNELNTRIDNGEIIINGSLLIPHYADSFTL